MYKLALMVIVASLAGCVAHPNQYSQRANLNASYQNLRDISRGKVESFAKEMSSFLKGNSEESAIEEVKKTVANSLRDPESAQFRNVRVVELKKRAVFIDGKASQSTEGFVVCGEVNGKNGYGGYVGFRPFVAGISESMVESRGGRYPEIDRAANAGLIEACGT